MELPDNSLKLAAER